MKNSYKINVSAIFAARRRVRAKVIARQPAQAGLREFILITMLAFAACVAFAPRADAQVFGSQPYVAPPDPAVEELRRRVDALEADLKRAVSLAESLGAELADARRIADEANAGRRTAEGEIKALKDRVEVIEEKAADAQPQQQSSADGVVAGPAAAPAAPAFDTASLPKEEPALFEQGYNLLLTDGNFPGAQSAFQVYLTSYPKGPKAADAQYYLGESFLYQDNYAEAASAYGKLIKDFANAEQAPTGLVKLARSLRLMGQTDQACRTLALMPTRFPKASAVAKQLAAQERQYAKCS